MQVEWLKKKNLVDGEDEKIFFNLININSARSRISQKVKIVSHNNQILSNSFCGIVEHIVIENARMPTNNVR